MKSAEKKQLALIRTNIERISQAAEPCKWVRALSYNCSETYARMVGVGYLAGVLSRIVVERNEAGKFEIDSKPLDLNQAGEFLLEMDHAEMIAGGDVEMNDDGWRMFASEIANLGRA